MASSTDTANGKGRSANDCLTACNHFPDRFENAQKLHFSVSLPEFLVFPLSSVSWHRTRQGSGKEEHDGGTHNLHSW